MAGFSPELLCDANRDLDSFRSAVRKERRAISQAGAQTRRETLCRLIGELGTINEARPLHLFSDRRGDAPIAVPDRASDGAGRRVDPLSTILREDGAADRVSDDRIGAMEIRLDQIHWCALNANDKARRQL
jgi:hypothetical protein